MAIDQFKNMSNQARYNTSTAMWLTGLWLGGPWGGLGATLLSSWAFGAEPPKAPDPQKELLLNGVSPELPIPIVLGTRKITSTFIYDGTLEATPIEEGSSGGSGGEKAVTGYKYKINTLDAICQANDNSLWVSRAWANGQDEFFLNSDTISIYTGRDDQSTDSMYSAEVDNPIPFKNLCYTARDSHPNGETPQAPVFSYEVHNYPYDSNAGDTARVYSYVEDIATAGDTFGLSVKSSDNTIWMINDDNELLHYDKEFGTLLDTVDISAFSTSIDKIRDVMYLDFNGKRQLHLLWSIIGATDYQYVTIIDLTLCEGKTSIPSTAYSSTLLWDNATGDDVRNGSLSHNNNNIFVSYGHKPDATYSLKVKKYSFTYGLQNTYDLVTGLGWAAFQSSDCNDDVFILHYNLGNFGFETEHVKSFDTATFTNVDTLNLSNGSWRFRNCAFLKGGNEVAIARGNYSVSDMYMDVIGFDADGDNLTEMVNINISDYIKDADFSGTVSNIVIKWCVDGNLLLTFDTNVNDYDAVLELMTSLNPSQAVYYLLTTEGGYDSSDLSSTLFQDFSDFCFDNQLGLSDYIDRQEYALERATIYVNMYQCRWKYDSDFNLGVKAFRDSDTSAASLTDDDLVMLNGKYGNFEVKPANEIPNDLKVVFFNRRDDYKKETLTFPHYLAQQEDGRRIQEQLAYFCVPQDNMVGKLANRAITWVRNKTKLYELPVTQKYMYLSEGDLITVTSSNLNLSSQTMRILEISEPTLEEGDSDPIIITAAIEDVSVNSLYDYTVQKNNALRPSSKPPIPVTPFIFEQDAAQNNDTYSICLGALNYDNDTIGAEIWVSVGDQSNFNKIGDLKSFAIVGDIVTSIDEDDDLITVNTGQYPNTFPTYTITDQVDNLSYCLCGELQSTDCELNEIEFVSYREAEASGANINLRNCFRGRYYTTRKSHDTDGVVILTGLSRFFLYEIPEDYVGRTLYVKMVAYNSRGKKESLSDVSSYSYTIQGWTRKATKVSQLELYDTTDSEGMGSLEVYESNDVTIQWIETNRVGGAGRTTAGQYLEYIEGDAQAWDLLIFNSSKTYVTIREDIQDDAQHTADADGVHRRFVYTEAYNTADFGGLTKDLYLAVVPKNARGDVRNVGGTRANVELKHVIINT